MQRLCTPLANITKPCDNSDLPGNHDIRSSLDAINQTLPAPIQVIKLGLCDRVVHIHSWNKKFFAIEHSVEMMHTRCRFFRNTVAILKHVGVFVVDEGGEITAIVQDEVEAFVVFEGEELLLQTPIIFIVGFAFPGEDGGAASGDGGCCMILRGEDVAGSGGR